MYHQLWTLAIKLPWVSQGDIVKEVDTLARYKV